jgi:hypothetical protein
VLLGAALLLPAGPLLLRHLLVLLSAPEVRVLQVLLSLLWV